MCWDSKCQRTIGRSCKHDITKHKPQQPPTPLFIYSTCILLSHWGNAIGYLLVVLWASFSGTRRIQSCIVERIKRGGRAHCIQYWWTQLILPIEFASRNTLNDFKCYTGVGLTRCNYPVLLFLPSHGGVPFGMPCNWRCQKQGLSCKGGSWEIWCLLKVALFAGQNARKCCYYELNCLQKTISMPLCVSVEMFCT